jgi:hypothetical protein
MHTKEIFAFKNMRMFMSQQEVNRFFDSLTTNDPLFREVRYENQRFCEFKERSEVGTDYYGYLLPSFTNGLMTKLTIFYSPKSNPSSVTQYIMGKEQTLLYWGEKVNEVQNDLRIKLNIKYSSPINSGTELSPHKYQDYEYLFSEWEKDDMAIKFKQEVEKDDGLNNFTFCNYLLEYSPTKDYMQKHQKRIDKIVQDKMAY